MKTIILPGYSPHNKEWAEDMKKQMELGHDVIVHNWRHWTKGSFSLKREIEKIKEEIGDEKVNILAKSVGTRVSMSRFGRSSSTAESRSIRFSSLSTRRRSGSSAPRHWALAWPLRCRSTERSMP